MWTVFWLIALLVGSLVLIYLLLCYAKESSINRDHCPYCSAEFLASRFAENVATN